MSVSIEIPLTQNLGLVQVHGADPKKLLKWSGLIVADASAGTLTGTCNVPTDLAIIWLAVSVQIQGTTANNVSFGFVEDGAGFLFGGVDASRLVDSFIAPSALELPAPLILFGDDLSVVVILENNDTEDVGVRASALAWDQETARNLPQRFFWPGIVT